MSGVIALRPSSANRWVPCPGSAALEAGAPDNEHEVTREGTAAHYMAEQVLKGVVTEPLELVDRAAPNGVVMDEEMSEHIEAYVTRLRSRGLPIYVEHPISVDFRNGVVIPGNLDAGAFDEATGTLYIDDLKYGWAPVNVLGNWQFIIYAIGLAIPFGAAVKQIVMTVHQPRPAHPQGRVRSWAITFEKINELWHVVASAAKIATTPGAPTHTGAHCRDCKALHICPAAREAGLNAVDVSGRSVPEELTGVEFASELQTLRRAKAVIDQRLDAIEIQATGTLKAGGIIPGFGLDVAYGKRKWRDEDDIPALEMITGKVLTASKPITPRAAERKGIPRETVDIYTVTPATGHKLVECDLDAIARGAFENG